MTLRNQGFEIRPAAIVHNDDFEFILRIVQSG